MASGNIHGDTNKTIAEKLMNLDISDCGKVRSLPKVRAQKGRVHCTEEGVDGGNV